MRRDERIWAALGQRAQRATHVAPWSWSVGLARSLLATGLALTLLATPTSALFFVVDGQPVRACDGWAAAVSLFCLVPEGALGAARIGAATMLLAIAAGWRPRLTALPLWWFAFSFFSTSVAVDGGDHVAGVLTLLLVPLGLTDPRRTHWDPPPAVAAGSWSALVGWAALFLLRLQVAVIYLHAAVAKFGVPEWADGTALYYWFQHPFFGAPPWVHALAGPVLATGPGVAALTWGTLVFELLIVVAIVGRPPWRRSIFWAGIVFHAGIALVMGLVSFAFSMSAALLLALQAPDPRAALVPWGTRTLRGGDGVVEPPPRDAANPRRRSCDEPLELGASPHERRETSG